MSTSLIALGDGVLSLVIPSALRQKIGKEGGDRVVLTVKPDHRPVRLVVPPALKSALEGNSKARATFDQLAPSRKKAYIRWVESAKQPETIARRVSRSVELLSQGKPLR